MIKNLDLLLENCNFLFIFQDKQDKEVIKNEAERLEKEAARLAEMLKKAEGDKEACVKELGDKVQGSWEEALKLTEEPGWEAFRQIRKRWV